MAMVLNLTAIKAPNMTISPASINVTVPGEIIVFVRDANKTLQEAFTLGVVSPFDSHLYDTEHCSICNGLLTLIHLTDHVCIS